MYCQDNIKSKRLAFFVANLESSGGTERVATVIANQLFSHGYEVHMISLQCGHQSFFKVNDGVIIDRLFNTAGRGIFRLPLAIKKLRQYLIKHKIDTVITVESMLALYILPAAIGLNVRNICWEHFNYNVDLGKTTRSLARKLAAYFADDVVTLTERDKSLWLTNTTCRATITAIPNPVTISLPTKINPHKDKLIIAVGRLSYPKGFDLLLQAWAQVAPLHPDWRLRIVGDGEDKIMLEQLRRDLNIEASTELAAKTNNIASHYQQASFFVMSSRFEGLPLVLIEAQAYGVPVISFDCNTGPAEIIKHGETGWLCETGNIAALGHAIQHAVDIAKQPDIYSLYSQRSVINVERFALTVIIGQWQELLRHEK